MLRIMKTHTKQIDQLIPLMSIENQQRYEDIKNFMREYLDIEDIENSEIVLEPTSAQDFVNFLFSIVMKSEPSVEGREIKKKD
jgi:hypothetical protein